MRLFSLILTGSSLLVLSANAFARQVSPLSCNLVYEAEVLQDGQDTLSEKPADRDRYEFSVYIGAKALVTASITDKKTGAKSSQTVDLPQIVSLYGVVKASIALVRMDVDQDKVDDLVSDVALFCAPSESANRADRE